MTCATCKFFHALGPSANGQCHRYPPQAAGLVPVQTLQGPQAGVMFACPDVSPTFRCGEYVSAPPVIAMND